MADDREIRLYLLADSDSAVRAFKALEKAGESSGKKLDETSRKSDDLGKHLGKLRSGLGGLVSSFGGVGGIAGILGGAGAVSVLTGIVSKTDELATEVEKFSSITGIGAQESLDYTAALKARGIGAEAGGKAFKFLAKNIQLAERQELTHSVAVEKAGLKGKIATGLLGVQALAFKRIGIQSAAAFKTLNSEQQFQTVIRAFSRMKDGTEKTQLAVQLFGRGGTALLPVLNQTSLGLEHQYQLAKKFFPSLKGEGVQALAELKEKQAESNMAWEGLEFTLGMKLIPVLTAVMGWFSETIHQAEEGKGVWGEVAHTFEAVAEGAKDAYKFIKSVGDVLGVHLGGGTLGAVLAAAGLAKGANAAKHALSGPASLAKKVLRLGGSAEGAAAEGGAVGAVGLVPALAGVSGALAAAAYGIDVYRTRKELAAHAVGALRMLKGGASTAEAEAQVQGSYAEAEYNRRHATGAGRPGTAGGGVAAGHDAAFLAAIANRNILIEHHVKIDVDGKQLAQLVGQEALQNRGVQRQLAEAVTHYGLKREARAR